MARLSLTDLMARPPKADESKLARMTEDEIRRHAVEDGEDPDRDVTGYVRTRRLLLARSTAASGRGMAGSAPFIPTPPGKN